MFVASLSFAARTPSGGGRRSGRSSFNFEFRANTCLITPLSENERMAQEYGGM
jgi:hypothetical protein